MTDQLSMRLDPALPRLPADLRPMLPRPAPEPFDSADHLFEPSWGGRRVLAFVEPPDRESLRLVDGEGRDLTATVPELADLGSRIVARSAVIDGELVVVDDDGRADPAALEVRLAGKPGPPVAYLVFDLLVLDGRPILREPLFRRRRELHGLLTPGDTVVAVPAIAGEGLALHTAVTAQGIAATMARARTSPYLPGTRSRLWRRIEASPAGAIAAIEAGGDGPARLDLPSAGPAARSPVLAVIRRLPFDEDA